MKKSFAFIRRLNLETVVWTAGLLYLALINPYSTNHLSFCLFRLLGFEHCPGCGLGLSISYILHGDFTRSFQAHPLGGAAIIILTSRIISLLRKAFQRPTLPAESTNLQENTYGEYPTDYARP